MGGGSSKGSVHRNTQPQAASAPPPQHMSHAQPANPPAYSNQPPPTYQSQPPPPPGYVAPQYAPGFGPQPGTYAPGFGPQSGAFGMQQPAYGYGMQPQAQRAPGGHVVVQGGFDPGARHVNGQAPSIPPPPPGYAPNAAQAATMQGQNVTVTQRNADWFEGGPGGGAVLF